MNVIPSMKKQTGKYFMRPIVALLLLNLLAACATTNVRQLQAPDGTAIKTVKCTSDPAKCFVAATESCPTEGKYRVISSASRAGGLAADLLPGPITWYYMTYACGPSDGKMPEFAFTGQQYMPPPAPMIIRTAPTTTTCDTFGGTVSCKTR